MKAKLPTKMIFAIEKINKASEQRATAYVVVLKIRDFVDILSLFFSSLLMLKQIEMAQMFNKNEMYATKIITKNKLLYSPAI